MSQLSQSQLARLWIQAGGNPDKAGEASAIAMAESSGNTSAKNASGALGPWQIVTSAHPNYNQQQLLDNPLYNAKAAVAISDNGTDFGPWVTWKTGAYKKFLSGFRGPARNNVNVPGTSLSNSSEAGSQSSGGILSGGLFGELGETFDIISNPVRLGKIVIGGILLIIALDRLSGIKALPSASTAAKGAVAATIA